MNIGIFGAGTIGGGVIKILEQQKSWFKALGIDIKITQCCVRDLGKYKGKIPKDITLVDNINAILDDESIDMVLEFIGGTTLAKSIVFSAIKKGKHVVTANKALVAEHLSQIEALLLEHPDVRFGYEAAIGGGIPIVHTFQKDLLVDEISQISGILNGTTNFMLSKMEAEGAEYADVLKEAQDLGYAEADPTADVGGFDARAKLVILMKLAFGVIVPEESIYTQGIENITAADFTYAKSFDSTIKLIAFAREEQGETLYFVSPALVPRENLLSKVDGATNALSVQSKNLKETILIGQGAGRFPTANAVVSDIISIAQGNIYPAFPAKRNNFFEAAMASRFYVRFQIQDGIGIVRRIGEICEKYGISIHAITQLPIGDAKNLPFILTTEKTTKIAIDKMIEEIKHESFCIIQPFFMPIL